MANESPTAAWILSLIGGILGLILSAFGLMGALATMMTAASTISHGYGMEGEVMNIFGLTGGVMIAVCGWFVIAHLIIIIGAFKIKSGEPSSVRTGGILVLIFSILGGLNILALIGGILALVWKPPASARQPAPPPPPSL